MEKKKYLIIALAMIVIVLTVSIIIVKHKNNKELSVTDNIEETIDENKTINEIALEDTNIKEEQKQEIETVKQSIGITGDNNLYEVQDGYNNTKIVTIKSSIKYKVAFSGMIKKNTPEISEIDNIVQENHPKNAGIWVYDEDRENVIELLRTITNSEYKIDENGYLQIINKNNQNENDKKIENAIKGDNLYIIRISSTCYIVDEVTGEVLDYNFENMDQYQTYEYFKEDDKMIIFITENSKKQLTTKEILESVINLF